MGIARRKAGTVVRCPSCASQVTVPSLSAEGPSEKAARGAAAAAPLFERSDFDELFNPGGIHTRPAAAAGPPPEPAAPSPAAGAAAFLHELAPPARHPDAGTAPAPAVDSAAPPRPGVWLTPGMLTLLSVGAVVALMLAFALGFLVGAWVRPGHRDDRTGRGAVGPAVVVTRTGNL